MQDPLGRTISHALQHIDAASAWLEKLRQMLPSLEWGPHQATQQIVETYIEATLSELEQIRTIVQRMQYPERVSQLHEGEIHAGEGNPY